MTTRVLVARHGEAEYGPAELAHLLSDHGGRLTEKGRAQARALAVVAESEGVQRVVVSPMSRAIETGRIVAGVLGVPVDVVAGLEEFGVGELVGRPFAEADAHFARWLADDLEHRIPGGEAGVEVVTRLHRGLSELVERWPGQVLLVVSHGGAISLSVPRLVDDPGFAHPQVRPLANCAVVHLEHTEGRWRLARPWP